MKNHVMQKFSLKEDGIPTWKYIEGCEDAGDQLNLGSVGPMGMLRDRLKADFAGQKLPVGKVIETYDIRGELYTDKNIKTALLLLESDGILAVDVPRSRRQKRNGLPTLGDRRILRFVT